MLKLFKSCFGFFKPKRAEFLLILISMLLFAAVFVPEFVKSSIVNDSGQDRLRILWSFSPLLVLGVSIGAGLGTFQRNELVKNFWFVSSVILILFFCGFLLYRENLLFRMPTVQRLPTDLSPLAGSRIWEGWLLCFFGTIGAWILTKSVFVVIGFASRKFEIAALTRQRLLVGVALVLFVCLTARNILDKNDVRFGEINLNEYPALQLLIGFAVALVGVALPAWAIRKIGGWWALLISVIYMGSLAGISSSFVELQVQFLIGFSGLCFSGVVVALTSYRGLQESGETPNSARGLWGFGSLTVALLTAAVLWNFSFSALFFGGSKRFELARQLKTFSTKKGVESQFSIWNPGLFSLGPAQVHSVIEFRPNADIACLRTFAKSTDQFIFNFDNVNPEIETTHIRNVSKVYGSISNSRVTFQQLEDIVNTSGSYSITNCQFVESSDVATSRQPKLIGYPSVGTIYLSDIPVHETARFLEYIDEKQFAGRVYIGFSGENQLSERDWRQIIERSEYFPITVYQLPPQKIIDQAIKHDPRSQLILRGISSLDRAYWNVVVNTQFSVQIHSPSSSDDLEMFWEAAFASRGSGWAVGVFQQMDDRRLGTDLLEISKQHHWIFEADVNGDPSGALIPLSPGCIDQVSKLTELKSLSLDVRWLQSLRDYDGRDIPRPQDISTLENLTKLKRLDLPSGLWAVNYAFLRKMPGLEELQFDVFVDGSKNVNFGFRAADCPNLKSLVLFGKPPRALALEIAKLPKLESVKLIDIDKTLMQAGQREMIQKAIGKDISLTIVSFEEDRPDVPVVFSEHVEKVREAIRKKYLSDDD